MRRRIAFVDYFPTHYRRRLYEGIAQRGEADFYFFADERERYWNREIPLANQGDYRRVELRRVRPFGEAVMPGLAPRLTPRRYDAVVKSLNGKLMMPLTYLSAKATGLPFVLWTGMWHHPTTSVHQRTKGLTEGVYRGADAIVCYGDHVRRFVLETPGVDPDKVFVAGQAVEADRFSGVAPDRTGDPVVLFVGQFEERKGLPDLLEAFAGIDDPNVSLRLVGNGSMESEIRALAARDPRVELIGYVPQEELAAQLADARCLVLPSVTTALDKEPWGLVVNEAMHAGVPVVATDAVGAAVGGLVRDGINGFVVPERSPDQLRTALEAITSDPGKAAAMGDIAREDAAAFNYDRMADAFLAAVEHAIAAKK